MGARVQLQPTSPDPGSVSEPGCSIRGVLADDHAAMRRSLRLLLDGEEDVAVIAEAATS